MLRDLLAEVANGFHPITATPYRCASCRDTGAVTTVVANRRYTRRCDCTNTAHNHISRPEWQLHNLADLLADPGPIAPHTIAAAADCAKRLSGAVIITGPHADRLAVAMGNAAAEHGRPKPCFFRAQTIANDLEINFRVHYPRYAAYPSLIIVAAPAFESMREREAANFVELVDYRTDAGFTTVIATGNNQYPIGYARRLDTGLVQQHGAIPPDLAHAMTFQAFQAHSAHMQQILSSVHNWTDGATGWLYLSGGAGTGKTHLTVAACISRQDHGDSVHFQTAAGIVDDLRAATNHSHQMFQLALSRIVDADLLAIDDLGAARDTAFAQEQLYKILNTRYERRQATIINSNLTPTRLAQEYHRIGSRLRDQHLVLHQHINAPDYRVHGGVPQFIPEP